MNTYASSIAFGITQGWLHVSPPRFMKPRRYVQERTESEKRAEKLRIARECMQRLRDARRAQGLNAAGNPFTYPNKNKAAKKGK